jgi:hypothetical protein
MYVERIFMITQLVLEKLGVSYTDLAKKKHGNSREITYGELIDRILQDKGSKSCHETFSELGAQTFNRMIKKVFPNTKLNGGKETWFFYICSIVDHKYCSKCDRILSLSHFSKDKYSSKLGVHSLCRECVSKYQEGQYDRYKEAHERSYEKNKGKIRSRNIEYKYSRSLRVVPWTEKEAIQAFYDNCPNDCHVDHVIPLLGQYVSGLHVLSNLQYLTKEENLKKSNKYELQ